MICVLVFVTDSPVVSTTTSSSVSVTSSICFNGGYFVGEQCHCPSGFGGTYCEQSIGELFSFCIVIMILMIVYLETQLCENIVCKNGGACAIRNPDGPYISVCLCRAGISGDYCQLTGKKF